ncbi:olfactory receptor 8K1-like [Bombina bombina]|uniref:olfactory receptor 8K1-like n=1 Tax=Bombina bombina TaxID=8345 RepID=UPI00235A9023|nr:olfactory receptor 8K1-like [Bombina bombina]
MDKDNHTLVTFLILKGISDIPELQTLIFLLILLIYLIIVGGNVTILLLVYLDHHLHTPMYFFLGNLSLMDICSTTVTLHKVLGSFITKDYTISLQTCISQMFVFSSLARDEMFILTAMSYDRYVAISYVFIIITILKIRNSDGRLKAFYTCSSHLTVVILLYATLFFLYLRQTDSLVSKKISSLFNTAVVPLLNPIIYSLKNKDVKSALRRQLKHIMLIV